MSFRGRQLELARSLALRCLGESYLPKRLLGSGDFGSVWDLGGQAGSGSGLALKISHLQKDREQMDGFKREVYFLNLLKHTGLVPVLHKSEICGGDGMQILERFDGSLQDLGDMQAQAVGLPKGTKALTVAQLDAIVDLILKFDQSGVWHGDLKRGNILYSINPLTKQFRAVVADFGFAGMKNSPYFVTLGFVRNYGCPSKIIVDEYGHIKLKQPIPSALKPYLNRWQMYTDFIGGRKTFIIHPTNSKVTAISARRLANALKLPTRIRQQFRKYCPSAP